MEGHSANRVRKDAQSREAEKQQQHHTHQQQHYANAPQPLSPPPQQLLRPRQAVSIHWRAPFLMVTFFAASLGIAFVHHFYYDWLDGQAVVHFEVRTMPGHYRGLTPIEAHITDCNAARSGTFEEALPSPSYPKSS